MTEKINAKHITDSWFYQTWQFMTVKVYHDFLQVTSLFVGTSYYCAKENWFYFCKVDHQRWVVIRRWRRKNTIVTVCLVPLALKCIFRVCTFYECRWTPLLAFWVKLLCCPFSSLFPFCASVRYYALSARACSFVQCNSDVFRRHCGTLVCVLCILQWSLRGHARNRNRKEWFPGPILGPTSLYRNYKIALDPWA